ncbi:hypothetical protein PGB90_005823 [Kerria lacca]
MGASIKSCVISKLKFCKVKCETILFLVLYNVKKTDKFEKNLKNETNGVVLNKFILIVIFHDFVFKSKKINLRKFKNDFPFVLVLVA